MRTERLRGRVPASIEPLELGPHDLEDAGFDLGELLGVLAHEFRNPLASLQGCAQTLLERGDALDPNVREQMTEVIVRHAQRLDWLVRAAATFGGADGRGAPDEVDVEALVADACAFAGVPCETVPGARIVANERRLRIAVEAVVLSLGEHASARMKHADDFEVSSPQRDIRRGSRRWKLGLASRVLREEGCGLAALVSEAGTCATVRFAIEARGER